MRDKKRCLRWNSILFVPVEQHKLKKTETLYADAFIFDLEDSIKDEAKEDALKILIQFLRTTYLNGDILVRINPDRAVKEIAEIKQIKFSKQIYFVVPKVEKEADIIRIGDCTRQNNIIALIETPLGFINLQEIVSNDFVVAIGFGAEDYCALTGLRKDERYLIPLKTHLLMYAYAYEKPVFDMVEAEYKDESVFRYRVKRTKDMGFTGKFAIHPYQVQIINEVFKSFNVEEAEKLIEKYEQSESGFMLYHNKIIEKNHIKMAGRSIEEAKSES